MPPRSGATMGFDLGLLLDLYDPMHGIGAACVAPEITLRPWRSLGAQVVASSGSAPRGA